MPAVVQLSDWPSRANVEPWMVFNLCLALRHYGRWEEANRLANHVLQHWGHREGSVDMRLFVALEEALTGDVSWANEHLQKATARSDSSYDQDLITLAKALVEFQQVPLAERPGQFPTVREPLARRFTAPHLAQSSRDVQRSFRRAGRSFAQNGAGWTARWRFLRKQVW